MTVVNPTAKHPTHHLLLTQGSNITPLITCDGKGDATPYAFRMDPMLGAALKIYSGEQKFSDSEPPWTPIAQTDWSGGMGQLNAEDDATRYFDAKRAQTQIANQILAGAHTHWTVGTIKWWPGIKNVSTYPAPTSFIPIDLVGTRNYVAQQFTADAATYNQITVMLRMPYSTCAPTLMPTIKIFTDSSNAPGSLVTGGAIVDILSASIAPQGVSNIQLFNGKHIGEWIEFTVDWSGCSGLGIGTKYWIVVYGGDAADSTTCMQLMGTGVCDSPPKTNHSSNGSTWLGDANELFFYVLRTSKSRTPIPFEYRRAQYVAYTYDDAASPTAPELMLIGDQGVANSGSTTTLVTASGKGTATWAADEARGCVIQLVAGIGADQDVTSAIITGNTATSGGATTFTFYPALNVAPGSGTEYVIVGSDHITPLTTGWGAGQRITDVLASHGFVYFARGDATKISRYRAYNNAGTWTHQFVDEGGAASMATYLCDAASQGTPVIWKVNIPNTIARATAVMSWGDITFGTGILVGDGFEKITRLQMYEQGDVWVLKEGSWWKIVNDVPVWIPVNEFKNVMDPRNGKASLVHNVYLYSSLENGALMRYYNEALDGMGPSKGLGLPYERRGPISCMVGYPGLVIAAIDGGFSGYSSIVAWNGQGWHELWRAGVPGRRILRMSIKPMPGTSCDRLYFGYADALLWINVSASPTQESGALFGAYSFSVNFFEFGPQAIVITSRIYANLHTLDKYWHSILGTYYRPGSNYKIWADYQLDFDGAAWVPLGDVMAGGNTPTELHFSALNDVDGKWIRLRIRIETYSSLSTPILYSMVTNAAIRTPIKNSYVVTFRLLDSDRDLLDRPDPISANTKASYVRGYQASPLPVYVNSVSLLLDSKYCFVDQFRLTPYVNTFSKKTEGWLGQVTLLEV